MVKKRTTKPLVEQCEKVTIRFSRHHAERIAEQCLIAGIKPSQLVRIAGIAFVDHKYLDLKMMMQQVVDEQIRLRRDFNDAVVSEEG